jgi:hypothetical protein
MPKRSATADYSGAPLNQVAGSMLDPGQVNPPRLPAGLPAAVRKSAKAIIAENPHLDHSQTEGILRLAKMRERYLSMEQEIERDGFTTYDEKRGREVVNPLVPILNATGNAILGLEKSLAIAFVTRSGQVKKAEQQRPAQPVTVDNESGRVLRLA